MKTLFFVLSSFLQILSLSVCNAQNEANIWYFGNKAGLDFTSGKPVVLTNGKLNTNEGCATISNEKGKLLFYTDGITVWDNKHQVLKNGDGLKGHPSSTQSAVIVPKPKSKNVYYIFTVGAEGDGGGYEQK
jgi:hypothetical protein